MYGVSLVLHIEPRRISRYVFAGFVTLRETGIDFESRSLESSRNETRTADQLARTVTGRVPSLVHASAETQWRRPAVQAFVMHPRPELS